MTGTNNPIRSFFSRRHEVLICLLLLLATFAVYWQVQSSEFVNFDDNLYVTENSKVQAGLTMKGVIWAFTAGTWVSNCWHPLTWLSHMLDCQFFGLNAGGHHLTSLFFHIANTLLLFFVLKRMTGALWQSGFVAALFALHPLHVESVAWVSERKDVLSTLFWLLTMGAYCRYAERPGLSRYFLVLLFFVLGLMSKPMLVTLPFVLLLMDYWPLGRLHWGQANREDDVKILESSVFCLVGEKIPFFVLSALASIAVFIAEQKGGALKPLSWPFMKLHIANALVSYIRYLGKVVWPGGLAFFYPNPKMFSMQLWWEAIGSGMLLVCLTVILARAVRRFPYLAVGWLWYLGTLVPVIGVVQAGSFAMADRYTYVTLIGVFIMIAWGVPKLLPQWRRRNSWLAVTATIFLTILMAITWKQVQYWKNSTTLFEHALQVTSNNHMAHNGLGVVLKNQGRFDEAIGHYLEALRIKPDFQETHNNLGFAYFRKGDNRKAVKHYLEALRIRPDFEKAHSNLGIALEKEGRINEAISHFSEALRLRPDAGAYNNLGVTLFRKGDTQGAIKNYLEALRLQPDSVDGHYNLGVALEKEGRTDAAVSHYLEALRIKPDYVGAHNNLGIVLEKKGRIDEAIGHYLEALRIKPDFEEAHNNLGIALFVKGNIQGAIYHFKEALRLEPDNSAAKNNLKNALLYRPKGQ